MSSYSSYSSAFSIYSELLKSPRISLKSDTEDAFSLINGGGDIHKSLTEATIQKFEAFNNVSKEVPIHQEFNCESIVNHAQHCTYCRKFLKNNKYDIPPHVMKSLMYIITCIFILFLMDIFVRIGTLIKK